MPYMRNVIFRSIPSISGERYRLLKPRTPRMCDGLGTSSAKGQIAGMVVMHISFTYPFMLHEHL